MFDEEDCHFWFSTSDGIPFENMHNEPDSWTATRKKHPRLDVRLAMAATEIKLESDRAKLEPMPSYANEVALFKKNCDYKLQESSGHTKIVKKKISAASTVTNAANETDSEIDSDSSFEVIERGVRRDGIFHHIRVPEEAHDFNEIENETGHRMKPASTVANFSVQILGENAHNISHIMNEPTVEDLGKRDPNLPVIPPPNFEPKKRRHKDVLRDMRRSLYSYMKKSFLFIDYQVELRQMVAKIAEIDEAVGKGVRKLNCEKTRILFKVIDSSGNLIPKCDTINNLRVAINHRRSAVRREVGRLITEMEKDYMSYQQLAALCTRPPTDVDIDYRFKLVNPRYNPSKDKKSDNKEEWLVRRLILANVPGLSLEYWSAKFRNKCADAAKATKATEITGRMIGTGIAGQTKATPTKPKTSSKYMGTLPISLVPVSGETPTMNLPGSSNQLMAVGNHQWSHISGATKVTGQPKAKPTKPQTSKYMGTLPIISTVPVTGKAPTMNLPGSSNQSMAVGNHHQPNPIAGPTKRKEMESQSKMAYANQLARCSSYPTNNSDERIANEWKKKNKALLKTAQEMIEGQDI